MLQDIAIVGLSALFPGSIDTHGFWCDILRGRDLLTDVPPSKWLIDDYFDADPSAPDKTYAKRGGFLSPVPFDPLSFGIPPKQLESTDSSQLLALIVAQRVLEDVSQGQFAALDRSRISVILGVTSAQELLLDATSRLQRPIWLKSLRDAGVPEAKAQEVCDRIANHYVPWTETTFPGLLGNVVAGRIANRLNLGGCNFVTDAACASSLSAIAMAVDELRLGHSDMVVTGGVDTMTDIFMFMCFSKTPALSKSGDCRPFSADADGTLLGEGIGMVALERLEDARAKGHPIYAILKSVGSSSDGRSGSVYAPSGLGQAVALKRAYAECSIDPKTVGLVEAHGTGTKAGDAAEFEGLKIAFEGSKAQSIALGSIKSQLGHTKAAAGVASLCKAVFALHHGVLPPTIKVSQPNPKLQMEQSPFYLNTQARPWISQAPRRAGVSAMGFGGSNFHAVVEEPPRSDRRGVERKLRIRDLPFELVFVTANTKAELAERARAFAEKVTPGSLSYHAYQTQKKPLREASVRLCVLAHDETELSAKLNEAAEALRRGAALPIGTWFGQGSPKGGLAFLFPGQGSQHVGMTADLAMHFDLALNLWDRASAPQYGLPAVSDVVFPPPAFKKEDADAQDQRIRSTQCAQPALAAGSACYLELLDALGLHPDAVAGHSFGEIAALYAAQAIDFDALMKVAHGRGELMAQAATTDGAMLAVLHPFDELQAATREIQIPVTFANLNSPKQTVVSGRTADIDAFAEALQKRGIICKRLAVSTAFHSPIVASAVKPFHQFLKTVDLHRPAIPVYANVTAKPHPEDVEAIRESLAEQIAKPVRFVELIRAMYDAGIRNFVEVGPGNVLSKLVDQILEDKPDVLSVAVDHKKKGFEAFFEALAVLATRGFDVKFGALWSEYQKPVDPSQNPTPKMTVMVSGANLGKPYPPKGGTAALPKPVPEPAAMLQNPATAASSPALQTQKKAQLRIDHPMQAVKEVQMNDKQSQGLVQNPASRPEAGDAMLQNEPSAWLKAWRETERATAEAHLAWQKAMTETHLAFLRMAEAHLNRLGSLQPGAEALSFTDPVNISDRLQDDLRASPLASPDLFTPDAKDNLPHANVFTSDSKPDLSHSEVLTHGSQEGLATANSSAQAQISERPAAHVKAPKVSANNPARCGYTHGPAPVSNDKPDANQILRSVVAEKTGYPLELLNDSLTLEADLGIDSIKRVEILSALREKLKDGLKLELDSLNGEMTLGDLAEKMGSLSGSDSIEETGSIVENADHSSVAPAHVQSASSALVLHNVIAEKTGYPLELLNDNLSLEADLGIDSIKRVEILSALREQLPNASSLALDQLNGEMTLGELAQKLSAGEPKAQPKAPKSQPATPKAAPANSVSVEKLLRDVIAEKTGYPLELLNDSLSLEADLGIDSIKRVEILSALREQLPDAQNLSLDAMNGEMTLGALVNALKKAPEGRSAPPDPKPQIVELRSEKPGPRPHLPQVSIRTLSIAPHSEDRRPNAQASVEESTADLTAMDSIEDLISPERTPAQQSAEPVAVRPTTNAEKAAPPVDAASKERPSARPKPDLKAKNAHHCRRLLVDSIPMPPSGMTLPHLRGGKIAVTDDPLGLGAALVPLLCAQGLDAHLVSDFTDEHRVIWTHGVASSSDLESAIAANFKAFSDARKFGRNLGQDHGYIAFVQDTGGRFMPENNRAYLAGPAALARTAVLEWPNATVRAIDLQLDGVDDIQAAAQALCDELLEGGPELNVGLTADGRRWIVVMRETDCTPTMNRLSAQDVHLVSGGGRGVTAATVCELAQQFGGHYMLLGRTELKPEPECCKGLTSEPDLKRALASAASTPAELNRLVKDILAVREIRATLSRLESLGCPAAYRTCNVTKPEEVASCASEARNLFGPITSVIHGAGVIADKAIVDKSDEAFMRVFETKVRGLDALLKVTKDDPLKILIAFSSVVATCGNKGQCDYGMANEILNKLVQKEAVDRPGLLARAFGFGPFDGGMVTPSLAAHFKARGVDLIPVAEGAKMICAETMSDMPSEIALCVGYGKTISGELPPSEQTLLLQVSQASHPELIDHSVRGVPVVPMALVIEWFLRAGQIFRPDTPYTRLKDLEVLRGIQLENPKKAVLLALHCKAGSEGQIELSLTQGETRHYRATLWPHTEQMPSEILNPALEPWNDRPIYGDVLFHGPSFQVIEKIEGVGPTGLAGQLKKCSGLLALDGALQCALLFAREKLGCATLPMRIGAVTLRPAKSKLVRCVLAGEALDENRVRSTIQLKDADGHTAICLKSVEVLRIPEAQK